MFNDGTGFKKAYIAPDFRNLRKGFDGLARSIRFRFNLDPHGKNTLFLFCGKRIDRVRGLVWESDVFLILYKRKENGNFCWLRTADEALEISLEQHRMLKQRLEIVAKWPIEESSKPSFAM